MSNSNDLFEDGICSPGKKSELPVELPDNIDLKSQGNPLRQSSNWKNTKQNLLEKKLLEKQIL